jgi:hypothetical protein
MNTNIYVTLKQWKHSMSEKKTRTCCGNSETATTQNFALWTFCNSHNTFWHVKNCHEVKFASWLLEKMTTTRSGNTKLSERDVVVSFYSHDTMWGISQVEKSSRLNWATQFLTVAYDGACSPKPSLRMVWISFGTLPCRKKNLMTSHISMLLKSRTSPDMLPFSLCNKKRLAIWHVNRSLFSTTLLIPFYNIGK